MLKDWDRIETLRSVRERCVGIQDSSCWTEVNGMLLLWLRVSQIEAGARAPRRTAITSLYCKQHQRYNNEKHTIS